jgi:hypothetical protein
MLCKLPLIPVTISDKPNHEDWDNLTWFEDNLKSSEFILIYGFINFLKYIFKK